jgi:hypothetical protein
MLGVVIWLGTGAEAHVPHPGLDFYIAIEEPAITRPNGATATAVPKTDNDCDTDPASSPGSTCTLPPGSRFTVKVYLKSRGGIVYSDYTLDVTYSGGLTTKNNPSTLPWPDCAFPAFRVPQLPGQVLWGCAQGDGTTSGSTYEGLIGTVDFNCTADGSITLVHGPDETSLDGEDDLLRAHAEGGVIIPTATLTKPILTLTPSPTGRVYTTPTFMGNTSESLAVSCNAPTSTPPATGTPTRTPPLLGGVASYPAGSGWIVGLRDALLAGLVALVVAAALSAIAWRRAANR